MDREAIAKYIFDRLRNAGYDMGRREWTKGKDPWLQLQQVERVVFLELARDIIDVVKGQLV